ncbi:ABC transporter substrate-binding protein [Shewanella sp. SNU WT4]|uniref:ABC transporter substrate-binding protein n=1 Tax=Shewanella sp. SNU WT4 TaxID=2590015 RepID=UPI001F0D634C|nr:ABC transporter substrate-binding protein [Shewanella sp. SNU WT4]
MTSRLAQGLMTGLMAMGTLVASSSINATDIGATTSIPERLVLSLGAEPDSGFDPILGWGKYNHPLFQSSLFKRDAGLNLQPDLANLWQLSADKLTWTINLHEQLQFSDGSRLDADDVKFTFDTAKNSASAHDLTQLLEVEVVSPTELKFHLASADINFIEPLTHLAIVPSDSYRADYGSHPIGSGPYMLVRWDKGRQLLAKANPYYARPAPTFAQLVIVFANEDNRFTQVQVGQLDVAAIAPRYAAHLPKGYKLWRMPSVDNRGIVWPMQPRHELAHTGEVQGNDVSADAAIRQAINLVVDRQVLVDQLLDGYARPAYSIADSLPWSLPVSSANDDATATQDRLQQAQSILSDAGWQLRQGVLVKDIQGKAVNAKLTLHYLAQDSVREQLALTVAQMVAPLGIIIEPKGGSWDSIATKMHQDPVLMGFGSLSASEVYFTHHSRYGGQDFYNSGFYANPKVDAALDAARSASSWTASLQDWQLAQGLIKDDQPWTWLVNLDHLYVTKECIDLGEKAIEPHGHGWPLINTISQWHWTCQP